MKRLFVVASLLLLSFPVFAQESIRARMDRIERDFGVSFVYSASLPLDSIQCDKDEYGASLVPALESSFKNSGIKYEIRKKNIILTPELPESHKISLSGYVTDSSTGETLLGAVVIACKEGYTGNATVTNEYGFYSLSITPGDYNLKVSYLGYAVSEIDLALDRNLRHDIAMKSDATLEEAVISDVAEAGVFSVRPGSVSVTNAFIQNTPAVLGEADILKSIQLLPGIQNANDGFSGINVRGGGLDENLIMLDGSALYNTNHLLGLTSVFMPEMVKKTTLYKSAFPARFGGRTSGIVDIRTKDGNSKETHGLASIGLLSDKIYVEGPIKKDKASFSVGGRLMHTGVLYPILAAFKSPLNYWFYDLNGKLSWNVGNNDRLYAGIFIGTDVFKNTSSKEQMQNNTNLRWGNILATLRWNHIYTHKLFSNLTVDVNNYDMNLSAVQSISITDSKNTQSSESITRMSSGVTDLRVQLDYDYHPSVRHEIKFGTEIIGHRFKPEASTTIERHDASGNETINKSMEMQRGSIMHGLESALYAEDNIRLNSWLALCPGIRLSVFAAEGRTYISPEPRFAIKADINHGISVKASATRMTQYIHQLMSGTTNLPTDMWVLVTKDIKPLYSDQISLGAYYTGLHGWEFSIEAYWKKTDNVLEYIEPNPSMFAAVAWENNVAMGKGRSYGLEFLCQKVIGKLTGMLSYTISKSDRIFPDGSVNNGKRFPYTYDRRHKINLWVNYEFNERIDLTATWTFASGAWYTLPTRTIVSIDPAGHITTGYHAPERNNYRLSPIHHLDIGVNFRKPKQRGERIWNIGMYNIYGAHNPMFVNVTTNYEHTWDKDVPVGAIGLESRSAFMFIPSVSYTRRF